MHPFHFVEYQAFGLSYLIQPDIIGRNRAEIMFHADSLWSRRDFVKLVSQAGFVAAAPAFAEAAAGFASDIVTVSILHTTDLHGHILPTVNYDGTADVGGLARCVTQ